MKQEFLNHQATLLYHIFEKDCKKMFPKINDKKFIKDLEKKLSNLNIPIDENSSWYKINKELRLISNVVKHGKGSSYNRLKELKPDLFKKNFGFLLKSDIEISLNDIIIYGNSIKNFWIKFFDIALVSEHRI
jgi:hypothetical protein